MATLNDSTFREGQSTTRPPFFYGNDYAYWKTRMRIYLQALDYEIWEVVCDGPFMPTFKDEVGDDIPKPSSQWSELEKRKMSLNSKAMNALFCALDKKEFHRVSSCESAQEIWNKLEVVYEGTNQVKKSKISRYTRQYELFQMEQNENVYFMYTRFTDIVNTLGALGKTFSNSEKVKRIIRSLPKEWRPKRTAIEEAKDLNTLPLDDLIGFLISYEEDLAAEKGHEEKKKSIALKASKYESDGESEPDDEELAMLPRRFRKFFKKTRERKNFRNFKNYMEKKEAITCYECKKPGHIRSECPLINKLKKKAMVATWDDSDEESNDEEGLQEVSNLALMAIRGDDDLNEGLKKKKNKWYLDNGCSRHMTGNYGWFSSFTKIENGGDVSFGDNSKGKILGIGNVVDDYSRYTWVLFLANKDDALDAFKVLCKKLQNEKGHGIVCIRSDHGGEFENHAFESFCNNLGIEHQFSSPRTPQQNGVVERKNRSIQEMARTMLNENALPKYFWAEAVNTACYVLNRVLIRPNLNKTPYELWKDRKPNISYFKVFRCKCFVLNTKDNLGKFDPKFDVGIFLGYSNSSKAYRVYNKRTLVVEESMHVTFDESNPSSTEKVVVDDDVGEEEQEEEASNDNQEDAPHEIQEEHHEEPNAEKNEGTKWVFRNKMDESGVVVRNKVRLVAQGYNQEEGIDFDETFAPVARSIRDMLQPWESGIDFDDRVYPNLVRVFYSNMEISDTRPNRIVTQVGRVPIEFDDADLADFLGISCKGLDIYTSRKTLSFDTFSHTHGVRNICRRRDLSDEICMLHFRSQLLPLQVRILHSILQHIVTLRKGHSDEVTRLDVALLDSLLTDRPINLGYIIVRHMLSTPAVNHRLLPYGSIIIKILRRFEVPLIDTGHMETRQIGPEAMTSIGFSRKNGVWIKTSNSKNRDTLIAAEDDRMLNDIYPSDQLPDFRLGAHHSPPRRRFVPRPPADSDFEERMMDADIPSSSELPPAPEPSVVPEQPSASMPPPAPVQPPASDAVQQLITDVQRISERQQLILDRLDTISRDHQQLRSDF
ncbi:hypothetical protein KPL70_004261 [Citrus sinensis]|nr:hypothetical protein KPL70_004261 [Citrus sinensis]